MTALGEYVAEGSSSSVPVNRKAAKQRPDRLGPQIAASNVGYQLLQKAGWSEGQGIGANQQGRPVPLAAYHQQARQGIGANTTAEHAAHGQKRSSRQDEASASGKQAAAKGNRQKPAQPVPDVPEELEVKRQRHQQVS